jgi:hypothetical protein
VAVPRLVTGLLKPESGGEAHDPLQFKDDAWDGTVLNLKDAPGQRYRSLLTGEIIQSVAVESASGRPEENPHSTLQVSTLLADFPVILLVRETP